MKINKFIKYLLRITVPALFVLILGSIAGEAETADPTWTAFYWNNRELSGDPVLQRQEAELNHDWGTGSPDPAIVDRDNFSARWLRDVYFPAGTYRFTATTDDGMRVWVDDTLIIDSWTESEAHSVSGDITLGAGDHQIEVQYFEASGEAVARLSWTAVGGSSQPTGTWLGEYFNNTSLSGSPAFVRNDNSVNFNWGTGSSAPGVIGSDNFSVRWTNALALDAGSYRFTAISDDGVRVWVNNQLIIDAWSTHAATDFTSEVEVFGGNIPVRVEYFENTGQALVNLYWVQTSTAAPTPSPIPDQTDATGVVQSPRLNIRYGPGLQYGVIDQLEEGEVVNLLGYRSVDGNWVMINWQGTQAWVSGLQAYLTTTVPVSSLTVWTGTVPGTGGSVEAPTAQVAFCNYLNVRSGPGVSNEVVDVIPAGTIVTLLGRDADAGWARIRLADNTLGWVSATYLIESVPLSTLPVLAG